MRFWFYNPNYMIGADTLVNIALSIGLFSAIALGIAAGVAFVGKKWVNTYFQKQQEKYETELEKEKIRYSNLYNKRAKIIEELYQNLVSFDNEMRSLSKPFQGVNEKEQDEKMKDVAEEGEKFQECYEMNKIYLEASTCEKIDELISETSDIFKDFSMLRIHDMEDNSIDSSEKMEKWHENWKSLDEGEVNQIKSEIEKQFRSILGVKNN